jgi:hypothetical protein
MKRSNQLSVKEQLRQMGVGGDALIEQVRRSSGVVDTRVAPSATNSPAKLDTISARGGGAASLGSRTFIIDGETVTEEQLIEAFGWVKKIRKTAAQKLAAARKYLKSKGKLRAAAKQFYRTHKAKISKKMKVLRKKFGGAMAARHKAGYRLQQSSVDTPAMGDVKSIRERLSTFDDLQRASQDAKPSPYEATAIEAGYLIHLIAESIAGFDGETAAKMFDVAEDAADFSEQLVGIEEGALDGEKLKTFTSLIETAAAAQAVYEKLGCPCVFEQDDDEDDEDE